MSEALALRPEIVNPDTPLGNVEVVASLSWFERVYRISAVRKVFILLVLAAIWEAYGRWLGNPLLFPTFSETFAAFIENIRNGTIPSRTLVSLETLIIGYAIGITLAGIFTTLAVSTRIGTDLLSTLTAMFNPMPAIALLPLSLLWFGLGVPSLVFVIVHSVLWAVALNAR